MLACLWKIWALPSTWPFRPHWSISRPAPTPSIFWKMEPALGYSHRSGWRSSRHCRFSRMVSRITSRGVGSSRKVTSSTTSLPHVQNAVVVAELEVRVVHLAHLALFGEDGRALHHLLDEHRPLALRRRAEEVQVLPDRAAHRAGDAHVVLQPAQPARHRHLDQVVVDLDARTGADARLVQPLDGVHLVLDHQPAKPAVAHQDVGAEAEQEERDLQLARGLHRRPPARPGSGRGTSGPPARRS